MAASSEAWAVALWEYYLPSISGGAPFYLAADTVLIQELYASKLGGQSGRDAALREFDEACRALVDTTGARTVVRHGVLRRLPSRAYSRAICLAVQQVLVVERMLDDGQDTEHSYFPRYRKALGLSDIHEHSNPMSGDTFRGIWEVLEGELRSTPGAGDRTVTFSAGRGRDVNRSFPLSQALFTTHDLTVIRDECPWFNERTPERTLLTALLRVRIELGVRAGKLLTSAATDEVVAHRLCEQVRSFLGSDVLLSLRTAPGVGSRGGQLVAYLERADLFDVDPDEDEFRLYHRSEGEQSGGSTVETEVAQRLAAAPVVLLVPDADGFSEWSRQEPQELADSVLAIVETQKAHVFTAQVARLCGAVFATAKSNLPGRFALLVCSCGIGTYVSALLGPRESVKRIQLEGGLLVDARSRVFLAGYPPTVVRYDERVLTGEEYILVGGVRRRVQEFLETLRSLHDARYTIQVGPVALSFSVATRKQPPVSSPQLAYALRDSELDLVARPASMEQSCLRGTYFLGALGPSSVTLESRDVGLLLQRGKRLAIGEAGVALLVAELRRIANTNSLASLAARQISVTRSIPLKAALSGLMGRLRTALSERTRKAN